VPPRASCARSFRHARLASISIKPKTTAAMVISIIYFALGPTPNACAFAAYAAHPSASVPSTLQRRFQAPYSVSSQHPQRQFQAPPASVPSTLQRQFQAPYSVSSSTHSVSSKHLTASVRSTLQRQLQHPQRQLQAPSA